MMKEICPSKTLGSLRTIWCYKSKTPHCIVIAARTSNPAIINLDCHVYHETETAIFLLKASSSTATEQAGVVTILRKR
jgi:hypothetical protein